MLYLNKFLFVLALLVILMACEKDEDDELNNLSIQLARKSDYKTFDALIEDAGLSSNFSDKDRTFTVFGPSDFAFRGADLSDFSQNELKSILLYHMYEGEMLQERNFNEGLSILETVTDAKGPDNTNLSLLVYKKSSIFAPFRLEVNGIDVSTNKVTADNGVLHGISGVLTLPTVLTFSRALPEFKELSSAFLKADGNFVDLLSNQGPWTLLAPTNSAFEQANWVGYTREDYQDILLNHLVQLNMKIKDLADGQAVSLVTAAGNILSLTRVGDNARITGSNGDVYNVLFSDLQATNGVVHAIDGVLVD